MSENVDKKVLGQLEESEQATLRSLKDAEQGLIYQIGFHEVEKMNIYHKLNDIHERAKSVLEGVKGRLDIPEGAFWKIEKGEVVQYTPSESSQE